MNNLLKQLPYDINMIILEYEGSVKKRNGVFMNQIPKNDYRYNILLDIPEKKIARTTYGWGISYDIYVVFKTAPYSSLIRYVTIEKIVDTIYIDYVHNIENFYDKNIINKYINGYTHRFTIT